MKPQIITITYDRWNDEYRVPGINSAREAEAYYTNDRDDALATAGHIHGHGLKIKIKKVDEHPVGHCLPRNDT